MKMKQIYFLCISLVKGKSKYCLNSRKITTTGVASSRCFRHSFSNFTNLLFLEFNPCIDSTGLHFHKLHSAAIVGHWFSNSGTRFCGTQTHFYNSHISESAG